MANKRYWLLVLLMFVLVGCSRQQSASSNLNVVTSVDFYAEVAKAVVGTHGSVHSVINDPAVDPHDFTPTVADGKLVAQADVVLANGAGYDAWMSKLTAAEPHVAVVSAAKVVGVHDGQNEHIWYNPTAMPQIANALAKRFAQRDPKHKAAYAANAKRYIASLKPLMTTINSLRAKQAGQFVAVSEPVFDNALQYLGYQVANAHFASAVEEGSDPSPADIRDLQAQITAGKIRFFVRNTQVQSAIVDNAVAFAKHHGVPVLDVTETLPKHLTYTSWMTKQYHALARILQ